MTENLDMLCALQTQVGTLMKHEAMIAARNVVVGGIEMVGGMIVGFKGIELGDTILGVVGGGLVIDGTQKVILYGYELFNLSRLPKIRNIGG